LSVVGVSPEHFCFAIHRPPRSTFANARGGIVVSMWAPETRPAQFALA
jgi:hypothetical protein